MEPDRHVILLTSDDCGFCQDAKEVLGRLQIEFAFGLTEIDIRSPQGAELAQAGGLLFPPGIVIDGEPFGYGRPSEKKLRRRLALQIPGGGD